MSKFIIWYHPEADILGVTESSRHIGRVSMDVGFPMKVRNIPISEWIRIREL